MGKYLNPIKQLEYLQDKAKPSMAYQAGEDVGAWKIRAKTKLIELTGLDKFIKVDNDRFEVISCENKPDYLQIKFKLFVEEKTQVVGYLLMPNLIENPPLMICLQGHSNGMHLSLGIVKNKGEEEAIAGDRDFDIQAVKRGYGALVIEQRNFGERKTNDLPTGTDCHVTSMYELLLGRTTIAGRVWDVSRTLDAILLNYPQIDNDRISILGNSGGGTIAYYATCLEDRISACMPSCAVCTYRESIATISHCVCNHIPSILQYFEMADLSLLIAPRPMVVVCGRNDDIFPLKYVLEAYKRIEDMYKVANTNDNLKLIVGKGGHRFYADEGWNAFCNIL